MTTARHYSEPDRDPIPELCAHQSHTECTPDCDAKARRFDEWLRKQLKEEFARERTDRS